MASFLADAKKKKKKRWVSVARVEEGGRLLFPTHRLGFQSVLTTLWASTFCLLDGNIASEDSSLSDALVLEDGRFVRSLLLKVESRLNPDYSVCSLGMA